MITSSTMSSLKNSLNKDMKNRRVPNAFMLFVKEHSQKFILQECPDEDKTKVGTYLGRKWKSLPIEEKQVYFDKYKALKAVENEELDYEEITAGNLKYGKNDLSKDTLGEKSIAFKDCQLTVDSLSMSGKQKHFKKVRRSPNAFMIFAKEQRRTLDLSIIKDKKNHVSTVLGHMWRELSDSEKAKYFQEARRLLNLHRKSEIASLHKILKKKNKVQFETASKKPRKKKKEFVSNISTNIQNHEANEAEKTETESCSNKSFDKNEISGMFSGTSGSHVNNNCPNSSYAHQYNSTVGNLRSMAPSVEPRCSIPCCYQDASPCCNSNASLNQNSTSGIGTSGSRVSNNCPNSSYAHQYNGTMGNLRGMAPPTEPRCSMSYCHQAESPSCCNSNASLNQSSASEIDMSKPCFGAGSFSPMFPPYPFNVSPWLYHQSMAHQWYPVTWPGLYPSPYNYCLPYSYNSAYNSSGAYVGYYSTQYSRRIVECSAYPTSHPNPSATIASDNVNGKAVATDKKKETSDDGQLVIDEDDPKEDESQKNGA